MRSKIIYAKIGFAVFLMVWLAKTGKLDLGALSISASRGFHLIGLTLVAVCLVVQVLRWWILLKVQGFRISFKRALWLSWVGFFVSLPIPGMAGGALARAYLVAKDVARAGRLGAVSTVVVDRIMGLLALLCLGIAALFSSLSQTGWDSRLTPVWVSTAALSGVVALLAGMAWIGPTRRWILGLIPDALREHMAPISAAYRQQGLILLAAFILSLLSALVTMGAFVVAGRAADETVSLSQTCQIVPLVFVAGTLPVAPDGIGVSETTAALLFSRYSVASGAVIMLIYRIWLFLLRLPGGFIFLLHKTNAQ